MSNPTTPAFHLSPLPPLTSITGQPLEASVLAGKVVLVVNVASRCGFTGQYAGLEALYQKYKQQDLVILGVPSNDFGGQEPGTAAEIQSFCSTTYNVTFPLLSKTPVTGPSKHPLYKLLTEQTPGLEGEVGWNFTKFVLDKNHRPVARFGSSTKPDDVKITQLLEKLLAE